MNPTPTSDLRPAPGRYVSLPAYVTTTDRAGLPSPLDWTNEAPRPKIGGRVDVLTNNVGTGTVAGYFHNGDGELGVLVELDSVPAFLAEVLPPNTNLAHFYGADLLLLDQEEDEVLPAVAGPAAAAPLVVAATSPAQAYDSDDEESHEDLFTV